jgi:hypothetical protein
MGNRKRRQPGPQHHAEGAHGEKTRRHFIQQLHANEPEVKRTEGASMAAAHLPPDEREQHDEAEK